MRTFLNEISDVFNHLAPPTIGLLTGLGIGTYVGQPAAGALVGVALGAGLSSYFTPKNP